MRLYCFVWAFQDLQAGRWDAYIKSRINEWTVDCGVVDVERITPSGIKPLSIQLATTSIFGFLKKGTLLVFLIVSQDCHCHCRRGSCFSQLKKHGGSGLCVCILGIIAIWIYLPVILTATAYCRIIHFVQNLLPADIGGHGRYLFSGSIIETCLTKNTFNHLLSKTICQSCVWLLDYFISQLFPLRILSCKGATAAKRPLMLASYWLFLFGLTKFLRTFSWLPLFWPIRAI